MNHSTEASFSIRIVRGTIILVFLILFFALLAAIYLRGATYKYDVNMEISAFSIQDPNNRQSSFSGPSFLGIQDDSSSITKPFGIYLRHLTSHTTAQKLHQNDDVLRGLFPEHWDAKQETWVIPTSRFKTLRTRIAEFVGYPYVTEPKPSVEALRNVLEKRIRIEDIDNSLRKVSIYIEDPKFGVELLNKLHSIADGNARDFVRSSTIERLNLLETRYDRTPISEVQTNLGGLLMHYKRILVMTDGGQNFAAEQFQSPVHGNIPSTPNPKIVFALAAAFGVIFFILLVLIRANNASKREQNYPLA